MDKTDLIYDIVKRTESKLHIIEVHTDSNTNNLELHMARTEANESRIKLIESRFTVAWVAKIIAGTVLTISTIVVGITKILGAL